VSQFILNILLFTLPVSICKSSKTPADFVTFLSHEKKLQTVVGTVYEKEWRHGA